MLHYGVMQGFQRVEAEVFRLFVKLSGEKTEVDMLLF